MFTGMVTIPFRSGQDGRQNACLPFVSVHDKRAFRSRLICPRPQGESPCAEGQKRKPLAIHRRPRRIEVPSCWRVGSLSECQRGGGPTVAQTPAARGPTRVFLFG